MLVVVSCIMVCQERDRGQGEKLLQDEAVRVTMLPQVSFLMFHLTLSHRSLRKLIIIYSVWMYFGTPGYISE